MYGYVDRSICFSQSTLLFGMSPSSTASGYIYLARAREGCIFTDLLCNYIYNYLLENKDQPHPQAELGHLP